MTIECMNFISYQKGSLLGFADIYVPKMDAEIYGISLYQKDGRRWVNMPSREYKDKETKETKYSSVFRLRKKENYEAFGEAVKKAIDAWCLENKKEESKEAPVEQEDPLYKEEELPF